MFYKFTVIDKNGYITVCYGKTFNQTTIDLFESLDMSIKFVENVDDPVFEALIGECYNYPDVMN